MKYRYTTLALLLGLFTASLAFGQNGTPKKLTSKASFERYPVSGMLYGSDSIRYYYDAGGRYAEIYNWYYAVDIGVLLLKNRTTDYVYDPNGNLLSNVTQLYSDTEGWRNSSRRFYTYDSNGSPLSTVYQNFIDPAGWVNDRRYLRTYDATGNILSSVSEKWNGSTWILNNALYFTYDAAGHVLTRTTDEFYRTTYAYDGAGNLLSEIWMSYEFGIWKVSTRILYVYGFSPGEQLYGMMYQTWNGIEGWKTYYKQDYFYNSAGDLADILLQYKSDPGWQNAVRYHYEYNEHHQEVFNEYQEWVNNAWAKHTRYFTTYDSDLDEVSWRREQWNSAWYEISLSRSHYNDELLPIHTPPLNNFLLFPNPANDVVTLKGAHLLYADIFDLKGGGVASVNVFGENEKSIQLSSIPSGNYVVRLVTKNGKISTKSLLVQH